MIRKWDNSTGGGFDKVINLTPHEIIIVDSEGDGFSYPSSGRVARMDERYRCLDASTLAVPLCEPVEGSVDGLPDCKRRTWYIVSRIVFDALPDRRDLLCPANFVREANGQITGARLFLSRCPAEYAEEDDY